MRIAIRAARDQNAQSRIVVSAKRLAGIVGLVLDGDILHRLQMQKGDVATRAMLEREAVADLLECLADVAEIRIADLQQPKEPQAPPEIHDQPAVVAEEPAAEEQAKKPRGRKAKAE